MHLPLDSALVRAIRGHAWTDMEWILHSIDSNLRFLRSEAVAIAGSAKPREPKLLPTPLDGIDVADAVEDEYRAQQHEEFAAFAARLSPNDD